MIGCKSRISIRQAVTRADRQNKATIDLCLWVDNPKKVAVKLATIPYITMYHDEGVIALVIPTFMIADVIETIESIQDRITSYSCA